MKKARLHNTNFNITTAMSSRLGLGGVSLMVFAIIYSFSKGEAGIFYGTNEFLSKSCGVSINTVRRALSALMNKGYVEKITFGKNIAYSTTKLAEIKLEYQRKDEPLDKEEYLLRSYSENSSHTARTEYTANTAPAESVSGQCVNNNDGQASVAEEHVNNAVGQVSVAEEHVNNAVRQVSIAEEHVNNAVRQVSVAEEHVNNSVRQVSVADGCLNSREARECVGYAESGERYTEAEEDEEEDEYMIYGEDGEYDWIYELEKLKSIAMEEAKKEEEMLSRWRGKSGASADTAASGSASGSGTGGVGASLPPPHIMDSTGCELRHFIYPNGRAKHEFFPIGKLGILSMTAEQYRKLTELTDTDTLTAYIRKLELLIRDQGYRTFSAYKTIKKWIYEDTAT